MFVAQCVPVLPSNAPIQAYCDRGYSDDAVQLETVSSGEVVAVVLAPHTPPLGATILHGTPVHVAAVSTGPIAQLVTPDTM